MSQQLRVSRRYLSILALSISSLVLTSFLYFDQFLNHWQGTTNQQLAIMINRVLTPLSMSINQLKFVTQSKKSANFCPSMLKFNETVISDEIVQSPELRKLLCKHPTDRVADLIIITVLLRSSAQLSNISQLSSEMENISKSIQATAPFSLRIQVQQFQQQILPKHLRNKLAGIQYLELIGHQLLQSRFMRNCRFTNIKCHNTVIIIGQWSETHNGYYEYDGVYFSSAQSYKEAIKDSLGLSAFAYTKQPLVGWRRWIHLRNLHSLHHQLLYLLRTFKSSRINLQNRLQFLELLVQMEQQLKERTVQELPLSYFQMNVLSDQKFSTLELMPNEFKLGCLLLVAMTFIGLPLLDLLKQAHQAI